MMTRSSRIAGFYNQPLDERVAQVAKWANLSDREAATLRGAMGLGTQDADEIIENVVGVMQDVHCRSAAP